MFSCLNRCKAFQAVGGRLSRRRQSGRESGAEGESLKLLKESGAINKTTHRFKHCEEAWRVLVGAKVVLFIESTKLFDGKLFLDVDFVSFLSLAKELYFHLLTLSMQYTPRMINGMESI